MAFNPTILNSAGKPRQGSGFTNLSNILDANKNNHLGQVVSSGLTQGSQQIGQGLQGVTQDFNASADKNNLASDANKNARQQALSNIIGGTTALAPSQLNAGQNDLVNDNTVKDFAKYRSGVYQGPTQLDAQKTLQLSGKAKELQGYGQSLQGGDKSQVLQAYVGQNNPYSVGQKSLDNLLLGNSPDKDSLLRARRDTKGLSGAVNNSKLAAESVGNQRISEAKAFGSETGDMLNSQLGTRQQAISDAVSKLAQEQQAKVAGYNQDLNSRTVFNNPELRALSSQSTYGVNPNDPRFLSTGFAPTASTVATPQQFAQLQALSKLSGQDMNTFLPSVSENRYDPSKAVGFDMAAYNQARAPRQAEYQNLYNGAVKYGEDTFLDPLAGGSLQNEMHYISTPQSNGKSVEQNAKETGDTATLARIKGIRDYYNKIQSQYGVSDKFR